MKKFLVAAMLAMVLMIPVGSSALNQDDISHSSYAQTADGVGVAFPCYLIKVKGKTDGTKNLTIKVYDNASAASGNVVAEFTIIGGDLRGGEIFNNLTLHNGAYIDMTTAGTGTWWIEYKKP